LTRILYDASFIGNDNMEKNLIGERQDCVLPGLLRKEAAMKTTLFKRSLLAFLLFVPALFWAQAQEPKTIKLNEPNKKRGLPVMEALSVRASVREWSDKDLSLQDLSDLLWAANGINRPENKKRTAASAQNAQDVDIYVFMKDGVFLYDAAQHALILVAAGDFREEIMMRRPGGGPGGPPGAKPEGAPGAKPEGAPQAKPEGAPGGPPPGAPQGPPPGGGQPSPAPIQLILVSDASRFGGGTPELKYEWGAIDTGLVSQNIALFCAGTGLATRPRAAISKDRIKELLKLKETQHPFLNHPVGYPK
jgi:nitroreductase